MAYGVPAACAILAAILLNSVSGVVPMPSARSRCTRATAAGSYGAPTNRLSIGSAELPGGS
jgi:hypothetical protein